MRTSPGTPKILVPTETTLEGVMKLSKTMEKNISMPYICSGKLGAKLIRRD